MKHYMVSRVRSVLEVTNVSAASESAAIEASRKLLKKKWKVINDKRRKNYKAEEVSSRIRNA